MGKAARLKAERRKAPPVEKPPRALSQRTVWLGTAGLVVLVGIVVGVLLTTRSTPKPPARAASSASDANAPAALVKAADAVGFYPTTEPGTGTVEDQPASAAPPTYSQTLLPVDRRRRTSL